MKKHISAWIYFAWILLPGQIFGQVVSNTSFAETVEVSGYVTSALDGEPLIGATIYEVSSKKGVVTDLHGYYTLRIQKHSSLIEVQSLGFEIFKAYITAKKDTQYNVKLSPKMEEIKEVLIDASASIIDKQVHSTEMSAIHLNPKEIQNLPSITGEPDVIKIIQTMPGISRGNEGGSGLFVRGGANDQNLVILDEAQIYSISHLFGFFSIFNSEAIKSFGVYKGGFPANYGGRLSSVLDVKVREGNMKKYQGEGSIGILSSKLTVEGPLVKDKVSFMVSGRRTYIDKVLQITGRNLPYFFYDFTSKLSWNISTRDRIYLSNYYGNDILKNEKADSLSILDYSFKTKNIATTLGWNHTLNDRSTLNFAFFNTAFNYHVNGKYDNSSLRLASNIQDFGAKGDLETIHSDKVRSRGGISYINHTFKPNLISSSGEISEFIESKKAKTITSNEFAAYTTTEAAVSPKAKLSLGIRLSGVSVSDKIYGGIEPRLGAEYSVSASGAIKGSYSRMKQYMHLVSSSTMALPTDLWYPVTKNVKPLVSDQFALGYFHNLAKYKAFFSVEGYYKKMYNLIEYKEGAVVVMNDNFEDLLLTGKGESYGGEVLLRKEFGKLKGFAAYTLSWSTRQFDGLNEGKKYYAKYDRRHSVSLVGSYEINKKFSISATWIYMSGSRFTAKTGEYLMPNASLTGVDIVPIYSRKNEVQMSPTHRLDMGMTYRMRTIYKLEGELHVGCYNAYNRTSPFKINSNTETGNIKYNQPGLFGFLPFVSYNFKF